MKEETSKIKKKGSQKNLKQTTTKWCIVRKLAIFTTEHEASLLRRVIHLAAIGLPKKRNV